MSYKLIWEDIGVKVVFENSLEKDDYLKSNTDIIDDPRFININYIIRDYLKVTQFNIDTSVVQIVASLDAAKYVLNPGIKIAIVSDKIVTKGLLNMFLLYFEAEVQGPVWETELFEGEVDARKWLIQD